MSKALRGGVEVSRLAIVLKDNTIVVKEEGCTGCGVCQYYCPTYPKSITIKSKAEKEAEKQSA